MTRTSVLRSEAIKDIEQAIEEKDDIIEKAQMKTLSPKDWKQVGGNRALQLTMLDRIIGECNQTRGGLTCSKNYRPPPKNLNPLNQFKLQQIPPGTANTQATGNAEFKKRFELQSYIKKRNTEDTLTYLEKLKQQNRLGEAGKICMLDEKLQGLSLDPLSGDSIFDA
ncbi:hypothetical protein FGO68_gene1033 [Halteria grandinella]|uniref:Uncharacterized protein n=1 Tax=Halteria grandinella TaxID=5974 RepID=A0A8J8T7U9_HALGN|nr:hypothetical protein FGO68_gene1033 [Halteria grandinella]